MKRKTVEVSATVITLIEFGLLIWNTAMLTWLYHQISASREALNAMMKAAGL